MREGISEPSMYGYKSVYDAYGAPFSPMPTYYVAYDGTADEPGGDLELGNVVSSARLPPGAEALPLTGQPPPPKVNWLFAQPCTEGGPNLGRCD